MQLTASLISEANLELLFSVHCRALKIARLSHDLSYLRCGSNSENADTRALIELTWPITHHARRTSSETPRRGRAGLTGRQGRHEQPWMRLMRQQWRQVPVTKVHRSASTLRAELLPSSSSRHTGISGLDRTISLQETRLAPTFAAAALFNPLGNARDSVVSRRRLRENDKLCIG